MREILTFSRFFFTCFQRETVGHAQPQVQPSRAGRVPNRLTAFYGFHFLRLLLRHSVSLSVSHSTLSPHIDAPLSPFRPLREIFPRLKQTVFGRRRGFRRASALSVSVVVRRTTPCKMDLGLAESESFTSPVTAASCCCRNAPVLSPLHRPRALRCSFFFPPQTRTRRSGRPSTSLWETSSCSCICPTATRDSPSLMRPPSLRPRRRWSILSWQTSRLRERERESGVFSICWKKGRRNGENRSRFRTVDRFGRLVVVDDAVLVFIKCFCSNSYVASFPTAFAGSFRSSDRHLPFCCGCRCGRCSGCCCYFACCFCFSLCLWFCCCCCCCWRQSCWRCCFACQAREGRVGCVLGTSRCSLSHVFGFSSEMYDDSSASYASPVKRLVSVCFLWLLLMPI